MSSSTTNDFGVSSNSAEVSATPSIGPIVTATSVTPNFLFRGDTTFLSATVLSNVAPVASVTVDASLIGGSSTLPLVPDGNGNYTNSVTVSSMITSGNKTLPLTCSDTLGNFSAPASISLAIGGEKEIWNGNGSDDNWSTVENWVNGVTAFNGDNIIFAGSTRLTPAMDSSYNLSSLTFDNSAGSFIIGTTTNTLGIINGITNNSANLQTLNVPIVLNGAVTVAATSSDVTLGGNAGGGGSLNKIRAGKLTLNGTNTYSGATTITEGTLSAAADLGAPPGSPTVNGIILQRWSPAGECNFCAEWKSRRRHRADNWNERS